MSEVVTDVPSARSPSTPWVLCPSCGALVYAKTWNRGRRVCPDCGHHAAVPAPDRLEQLLPEVTRHAWDPLSFRDTRPYPDRLGAARAGSGLAEAVLCARGLLDGRPVLVAVMDFRFLGGSLGAAVGEAITPTRRTGA